MNKPFKFEYANVEWGYDMELFKKWCDGRTGFPIGKLPFLVLFSSPKRTSEVSFRCFMAYVANELQHKSTLQCANLRLQATCTTAAA